MYLKKQDKKQVEIRRRNSTICLPKSQFKEDK